MKHTFGERFRLIRENQGLSQREFAQILGISQSGYSSVEKGDHAPSMVVASEIAVKFPQINLRWLLTGEDDMLAPASPVGAVGSLGDDPLLKELAEVRLLATRSTPSIAREIVQALHLADGPMVRAELATSLGTDPGAIETDIALLKRLGVLEDAASGLNLLKALKDRQSPTGGAEMALLVIDSVLRRVLPAADRGDGSGRILILEAEVADASQVMDEVLTFVQEKLERETGEQRMSLMLATHRRI